MVKIAPTKQELTDLAKMAGVIMDGWMTYFPAPECPEQQAVVDATLEWFKNAKKILDQNDHL